MGSERHTIIAFIGILYLSVIFAESFVEEKPSFLKSCKINEPEFTKCSTESIQMLFVQLAKGIPGLKALGPIDPFFVKKVVYKQDTSEVATISANLTDLTVTGLGNIIIKESRVSKKDFSWQTKVRIPKMRIDGDYRMEGKILVVPLKGDGKMFIELANVDMVIFTKVRLYEKGGFTFCNVTDVRLEIVISKLKTRFNNLFNGNKELENSINEFFNVNWQDVFEAVRPIVTNTIEGILLKILKTIFHYIPAKFFTSDIPSSQQLYGTN